MRNKYKDEWKRAESRELTQQSHDEVTKYNSFLSKAAESDGTVRSRFNECKGWLVGWLVCGERRLYLHPHPILPFYSPFSNQAPSFCFASRRLNWRAPFRLGTPRPSRRLKRMQCRSSRGCSARWTSCG